MMEKSVLSQIPCEFPKSTISGDTDLKELGKLFEKKLNVLNIDDFCTGAMWRDTFAFTGSIRSYYGKEVVFNTWKKLTASQGLGNIQLGHVPSMIMRPSDDAAWVDIWFTFETTNTPAATGTAILSLTPGPGGRWQVWLIRTILDQLKAHPSVDSLKPTCVLQNGPSKETSVKCDESQCFDCVVVGGGQAGLSVAGRLKALGLSYVVLESNKRVGDNWKSRYDRLKLHTTRDCAHLPFERTFPSDRYDKWLSKDDLAEGYASWVEKYDINIWLWTKLHSGDWNRKTHEWTLNITDGADRHQRSMRSKHVVLTIGAAGQGPKMPTYPGVADFTGTIMHSGRFKNAAQWEGRNAVVIGVGNSAGDVAEDMVDSGCSSVTMVQRSPTFVFVRDTFAEGSLDRVYNDHIPTEIADVAYNSLPFPVMRLLANQVLHTDIRARPEPYDALEAAGFKLNRYGDVIYHLYERFGSFYMDVGAVAKITNGSIKMKSDAVPVRFSSHSLIFDDGSELDADLVVFATGFDIDARTWVRKFFGSSVADQIEGYWGLDSEAELLGVYRPSGHPNLWFNAGGTLMARFFSRFIAQQIRADIDGTPLTVYDG